MRAPIAAFLALSTITTACNDQAAPAAVSNDAGADVFATTSTLEVPVTETGRVYVDLAKAAVVTPDDPTASTDWDLAFEGYDVYTNGGASGAGQGGAFGALDASSFLGDTAPTVPFISADKAGGAFLDWYAYASTSHVLYSRFHVYGVESAGRLWKVQVLTYYGTQDGAPTSAFYKVRYAEITSAVGATQTVDIDGTAGGLEAPVTAPSACLDLASGAITTLTVAEASTSTAWDLCFRREAISVNGEVGGPRGVGAVDLEASRTASEVLSVVEAKTADTETALFDSVTAASFVNADVRGDHVVSAFESGGWLDRTASPPAPIPQAWLVVDARGQQKFLVGFSNFKNATTSSPGTVVMHFKPVSG